VGTEKRERKKANKAARQEREIRQQRVDNVRRKATKWGTLLIVGLGLVVGIAALGGAFSGDDTAGDSAASDEVATDSSDTSGMPRPQPPWPQLWIALPSMALHLSSRISIAPHPLASTQIPRTLLRL
jgi:hypothetical protein